ncbi:MAG: hypothetical protein ACRBCL_10980 [Maritimibacter sp.]
MNRLTRGRFPWVSFDGMDDARSAFCASENANAAPAGKASAAGPDREWDGYPNPFTLWL